jgi:hypothetical protein
VQFEGIASEPHGPDLSIIKIYFATSPEGRAHLKWPDIAYFVVRPRWIRYSDYDQTPPVIEKVTLRS